jgi:hypothetical protein
MTTTTNTGVREALSKALGDIEAAHGATVPTETVERVRSFVAAPPADVVNPEYEAYGRALLAACRAGGPHGIDNADFAAWRAQAGDVGGKGVAAQIRLYREQRRTGILDVIAKG